MNAYQLSNAAALDLTEILKYSYEQHGERQVLKYNAQLKQCFETISINSNFNLYKTIKRNGKVIRSLRCQEHCIFAIELKCFKASRANRSDSKTRKFWPRPPQAVVARLLF